MVGNSFICESERRILSVEEGLADLGRDSNFGIRALTAGRWGDHLCDSCTIEASNKACGNEHHSSPLCFLCHIDFLSSLRDQLRCLFNSGCWSLHSMI